MLLAKRDQLWKVREDVCEALNIRSAVKALKLLLRESLKNSAMKPTPESTTRAETFV
jgi:hypothetical protein